MQNSADQPSISGTQTVPRTITSAQPARFSWATFPWWIIPLILLAVGVISLIFTNQIFQNIWVQLRDGVSMTIGVSFVAYIFSILFGLAIGLVRSSPPTPGSNILKVFGYNLATLYVETLRGLPILVVILVIAFAIVPSVVDWLNTLGVPINVRDVNYAWRAVIALTLTYSAFLSEVFRAGIISIGKGQIEAAKSLGMTYPQIMRLVVLPQAIRRVLPPLGNDLIAMIKDSSLVAILGVQDIAQLAKLSASTSFRYIETYTIAAMLYLSMTLIGSFAVRWLERRFHID